jgi:hypothetical protein
VNWKHAPSQNRKRNCFRLPHRIENTLPHSHSHSPRRNLTTKRNLSLYSAAPPLASHHQTQPLSLCSAAPPLSSRDRQVKRNPSLSVIFLGFRFFGKFWFGKFELLNLCGYVQCCMYNGYLQKKWLNKWVCTKNSTPLSQKKRVCTMFVWTQPLPLLVCLFVCLVTGCPDLASTVMFHVSMAEQMCPESVRRLEQMCWSIWKLFICLLSYFRFWFDQVHNLGV